MHLSIELLDPWEESHDQKLKILKFSPKICSLYRIPLIHLNWHMSMAP